MRLTIPGELPETTNDIQPLREVAGQGRAQDAIRFGLAIESPGYNIVISGSPSSGRSTIASLLLDEAAATRPAPPDWCYLYNFEDPHRPGVASVPAGNAAVLEKGLARLARVCNEDLPRAFDSENYSKKVQESVQPFTDQREEALHSLEKTVRQLGFVLNPTPMGLVPVPCESDGTPMAQAHFDALTETERANLEHGMAAAHEAIANTFRIVRHLEANANEVVEGLDAEITKFVLSPVLEDLRRVFTSEKLLSHFAAIEADITANLGVFKRFTEGFADNAPAEVVAQMIAVREELLKRYQVNVFVRRPESQTGAPVKIEQHPSLANLFGRVEFETRMGIMTTDFTKVRPGAIHSANGGFLVLNIQDLLTEPRSWASLKRALKTHEVRIGDGGESFLPFPVVDLVPEGIPLELKVVLIGEPQTIALLDLLDSDFGELFKVRAEFEPDVEVSEPNVLAYAGFVRRMQDELQLRSTTRAGLAEIVRYGSRLADRHDRLTTRYGLIADLCVEANHVAELANSTEIDGEHVLKALVGKQNRSELLAQRLRRLIAEGTLHVETSGSRAGQVNGLAVYQGGNFAFGAPLRISCRVGPGRQGVVAIERETERSGAIHTKGVLVISGFLAGTFGREKPLAFNASLTFEQSYEEVEGDSASSAELYAILTALADIPVKQSIAVTGSVDQFGNVQAVGGVTEKIEGFFDLCSVVGLTGDQGVIIPGANVRSLTLRPDVVAAVESGHFSIWAISRVEEGLEILTGQPAGTPDAQGLFPVDSIFAKVSKNLAAMQQVAATPAAQ
jgi:lon-related putative ATP-dependent protease